MAGRVAILVGCLLGAAAAQDAKAPTQRCEGRVRNVRGEPIPAARVWVRAAATPTLVAAQTRADGDGRFLLARVPGDDEVLVEASADGFAVSMIGPIAPTPWQPITLVEAVRVAGRLIDRTGRPVAHVTVVAATAAGWPAWDTATTDADGHFDLRAAPVGPVWTTAIVPGEGIAALRTDFPPPGAIGLAPAPRAAFDAAVVVRGVPAVPHPARFCALRPRGGDLWLFPPPWSGASFDANGYCEVRALVDLAIEVTPRVPGFVCTPLQATLTIGAPRVEFTAIPADAPELLWHGEVHDAEGRACAGIELSLLVQGRALRARATTNDRGAFRLRLPCPTGTEVTLRATRGDHALVVPRTSRRADVPNDPLAIWRGPVQTERPLELTATRSATLRGRVLSANGSPAPRADVALRYPWQVANNWMTAQRVATDGDGRFELRGVLPSAEPPRLVVTAEDGHAEVDLPVVEVAEVRDLHALRLVGAATVRGEVLDELGKPVPGLTVTIATTDRQAVTTFTDRRGQFHSAEVAAGQVRVALGEGGRQTAVSDPFDLAPGATKVVHLRTAAPPR